jgi:hypothetical protein
VGVELLQDLVGVAHLAAGLFELRRDRPAPPLHDVARGVRSAAKFIHLVGRPGLGLHGRAVGIDDAASAERLLLVGACHSSRSLELIERKATEQGDILVGQEPGPVESRVMVDNRNMRGAAVYAVGVKTGSVCRAPA